MNKEHLRKFAEDNTNLVLIKPQGDYLVLKYKKKVFFKNLWTPELCEFRGTVVDKDWNIVQRPFTKIFNPGERDAAKIADGTTVTVVEKVNGFMAAASIVDGKLFVSTTGSTDSDFVKLAEKHIMKLNYDVMDRNFTYIFEICDDSDPHIIPEKAGAYLLGARLKDWDGPNHFIPEHELDMIAIEMRVMRPLWKICKYAEIKNELRTVNHEGFVVWDKDNNEVKLKSPYYLVTKFLGRKSNDKLSVMLDHPEQTKKTIDEEFYSIIDYLVTNRAEFMLLNEQQKFAYVRSYFNREIL